MVLYINCAIHAPGVKFGHAPGVDSLHRLTSRPILIKFNVNHNWVGGLMALGFGADCIKIVVSMATDRSHRLTMGKTKKIFFSETTRPTALIFGM